MAACEVGHLFLWREPRLIDDPELPLYLTVDNLALKGEEAHHEEMVGWKRTRQNYYLPRADTCTSSTLLIYFLPFIT